VTNYGAVAILALPKLAPRQRYLLIALETVTADADGWRAIGLDLLARSAGLSVRTAVKARDELAKAGLIEWQRGTGRDHPSVYRLRFGISKPGKNAARVNGGNKAARVNPGKNAATVNPGKPGSATLANAPRNPVSRNAATSGNESDALEPIALEPSALSRAASDPRLILGGLDLTDEEIDFILGKLQADPRYRDDPAGYLMEVIGNGGGPKLVQWARRRLQPRPDWCGQCDEHTRMIEVEPDGRPMRCPRCASWNRERL
jgi:hypothetical protein